jgi:hypothetical protein
LTWQPPDLHGNMPDSHSVRSENAALGKNQESDGGARDCAVDQVKSGRGD